jgi:hypothetical protein
MVNQEGFEVDRSRQLEALITQGVDGDIETGRLIEGLSLFQASAIGQRFELRVHPDNRIVFCAGSWAIYQVLGSKKIASKITILGDRIEGEPDEISLSPYENPIFDINLAT